MKKAILTLVIAAFALVSYSQPAGKLRKKDRKRDVLIETTMGDITIRLSDSTPLHRDNFLKLVKSGFYKDILFHRVIKNFMIQAGDPSSRLAKPGQLLGNEDSGYRVPAEFRPGLFHKKGVIAAAREGDAYNPEKKSSVSQFYIVQGKKYTAAGLDSLETYRLKGAKIPADQRAIYQSLGGTPFLDRNYTVYGEVIKGLEVVDQIADVETSKGDDRDRPLKDVRIIRMKLVKRRNLC